VISNPTERCGILTGTKKPRHRVNGPGLTREKRSPVQDADYSEAQRTEGQWRSSLLRPEEPTDGRTVILLSDEQNGTAYKVPRPVPPAVTVDGLVYRLDLNDTRWTPVYRLEAGSADA
jgi:hypothetical protein